MKLEIFKKVIYILGFINVIGYLAAASFFYFNNQEIEVYLAMAVISLSPGVGLILLSYIEMPLFHTSFANWLFHLLFSISSIVILLLLFYEFYPSAIH